MWRASPTSAGSEQLQEPKGTHMRIIESTAAGLIAVAAQILVVATVLI
jgi:hypothetical protein